MVRQSRRRFVGTIAGAGIAALAGCNGLLGSDGDGDGGGPRFESDAEYVPASMSAEGSAFELVHLDIETFRDEFPAEAQSEFGLEEFESEIGIAVEDLGGLLQIQAGPATDHQILTGSFDASDVFDAMGIDGGMGEYEGYETILGEMAIDDGALIISTEYEALIDAKAGSADRLVVADSAWGAAVENAANGTLSGVETAEESDPWEITAIGMNARGESEMELAGYAHFDSESAAQDSTDAVEEGIHDSAEDVQDVTVEDVRVEGNVVVVEAVAAEYDI